MNFQINAKIQDLRDILVDDRKFYQIPEYQRPYSWEADNLNELIEDWFTAYTESEGEKYFCGSLVLVEHDADGRIDVVDGQQRLTTFVIIACVLRDVYAAELSAKVLEYVNRAIKEEHGDQEKLKFLTGEKYQTNFKTTVLNQIDFETKPEEDNRYLINAQAARKILQKKFSETVSVSDFAEWLFSAVVLTVITCPSEDSAIRIFDVLNSRGMPLTSVDILKAWLMQKLSKESRKAFNQTWGGIDTYLKDRELSMDEMLTTYLHYQKAPNSKVRLDKALKEVFSESKEQPIEIVKKLDDFSKSYSAILYSSIQDDDVRDRYYYCLHYLPHQTYWSGILVTAHFTKYPEIDALKKVLLAYFYQHWIAGSYVTRIKQTSLNIIKLVKSHGSIDAIKKVAKANLEDVENHATNSFKDEVESNSVYGKKWVRPLLLLVNYFSVEDSSLSSFVELNSKLHVEHVLPQNPTDEWSSVFGQEDMDEWMHSLANLTLLLRRKSAQAGNLSFTTKKAIYLGRDKEVTSFQITRDIANFKQWDVSALKKRKQTLLETITAKLDIF